MKLNKLSLNQMKCEISALQILFDSQKWKYFNNFILCSDHGVSNLRKIQYIKDIDKWICKIIPILTEWNYVTFNMYLFVCWFFSEETGFGGCCGMFHYHYFYESFNIISNRSYKWHMIYFLYTWTRYIPNFLLT